MKSKKFLILSLTFVIILNMIIYTSLIENPFDSHEHEREKFIQLKEKIITENLWKGKYQCCLEKPCTYCIEKSPGHGAGSTCHCLTDLMNGVHPCGECIGEILEGHGNPYLSEYFANAIAEKVGENHFEDLKEIVEEKYKTPKDQQKEF